MNERNCANCFWESKNEDFGFKCCPYNPDYRDGMRNDYFCEYFKERRYMNKIIIALVGKAGSGKDTVANMLAQAQPDWNMIVSCTTRPKRDGEQEGVNYFYLTNEEFAEKILNGDMLEATYFNSWHYGTMKSSLKDGVNIGVFNPEGFDCLTEMAINGVTVVGYLIDCKDKTRMLRQLAREEDPDIGEICRRYQADENDFSEFLSDPVSYNLDYCWNETPEDLADIVSYIQKRIQHIVDVGHV